jgi:hypothetical protein
VWRAWYASKVVEDAAAALEGRTKLNRTSVVMN